MEVRGPVNEAALKALQETLKHENLHVREEIDKKHQGRQMFGEGSKGANGDNAPADSGAE